MRRSLQLLMLFSLSLQALAASDVSHRLMALFDEAERCYLIDDYQRLHECIGEYYQLFDVNRQQLTDSADVYEAYYQKMCGSYYYGWAEEQRYAALAEDYYRKSLETFRRRVAATNIWGMHPNELTLHRELAQLYYKAKAYDRASAQLDTVFLYYDNKSDIPSYDAARYEVMAQLAICNARLGRFALAREQIDDVLGYSRRHTLDGYHETLRKKGKILMLQAEAEGDGDYAGAKECYQRYVREQYAAVGRQLAQMSSSQRAQYWLTSHQFLYDCFRLGNHAPEMLYDLALFTKGYLIAYERNQSVAQTDWKQVRKELGEKECAVEFVQYFGRNDQVRMGCLVLRHDSRRPLFIDLFATDSLLSLPLTATSSVGQALASTAPALKDILYADSRLPQCVWSPALMAAIGDARKVYFAADGIFHQWAIEYIMPDEQKACYRLTSTRLLHKNRAKARLGSALICGGIQYNAAITPTEGENDAAAYRFLGAMTTNVCELPEAKREVDSIYALRANPLDTLLTGPSATDENFISLLKRGYDVIHLSTHGFFTGETGVFNDIKPLTNDDSMSKSGLVFAGASTTLSDRGFDTALSDGILSAAELARQDFSRTKLIVLSACETGLGHLTADGVYGVQRALKQAGAQAMIVSLWRVNDLSCSLLMRYFYEEMQSERSADIHEAFLRARQRLMCEEHSRFIFDAATLSIEEDTVRFDAPRHVNPFILIDVF